MSVSFPGRPTVDDAEWTAQELARGVKLGAYGNEWDIRATDASGKRVWFGGYLTPGMTYDRAIEMERRWPEFRDFTVSRAPIRIYIAPGRAA